jgi:hypothetical protein
MLHLLDRIPFAFFAGYSHRTNTYEKNQTKTDVLIPLFLCLIKSNNKFLS